MLYFSNCFGYRLFWRFLIVSEKVEILLSVNNIGKHPSMYGDNRWWDYSETRKDNRPVSLKSDLSGYILVDLLHNWLVDNNISYSLREIDYFTCIMFENKSDAILFKLTWL